MNVLKSVHWFLHSQLGLNFIKLCLAFFRLPLFARDLLIILRWRGRSKLVLKPCLHDNGASAGADLSEYFFQDLFVAKLVFEKKPKNLLDIGSQIDGYVAHVASFRSLDVMDIRPMSGLPKNINFIKKDLMRSDNIEVKYDIITCLHAIEHFGLGRYGDRLSEFGHVEGLLNIKKYLNDCGRLILSTPVGKATLYFNANRVFSASEILLIFSNVGLVVESIWILEGNNVLWISHSEFLNRKNEYTLAIFQLTKSILLQNEDIKC